MVIAVDNAGENQIIIVPGANGRINETDVERLRRLLALTRFLQFEITISAVLQLPAA